MAKSSTLRAAAAAVISLCREGTGLENCSLRRLPSFLQCFFFTVFIAGSFLREFATKYTTSCYPFSLSPFFAVLQAWSRNTVHNEMKKPLPCSKRYIRAF